MSSRLQCYNPDGSITAPDQIPCAANNDHTHCCQQGATCLSNGLCFVQWDTSVNTGTCTDSTWKANGCFQHCLVPRLDTISTVYKCTDNNFCCSGGGNTTNCCSDPDVGLFKITQLAQVENGTAFVSGFSIAPNSVINAARPTSTPSSSASPSSSSAQATCAPASASPSASCNSDKTTIGVGVGVGMGIPLLTLALLFSGLWYRERKQKIALQRHHPPGAHRDIPLPYGVTEVDARQQAIYEMPSSNVQSRSGSRKEAKKSTKRSWGWSSRS